MPFAAQVVGRPGLDHARPGIAQRAADVGLVVLGDQGALAGFAVLGEQPGPVAPAAVDPVEHAAVGGVAGGRGGHRILEPGAGEWRGFDLASGHAEEVGSAVLVLLHRHAQVEVVVGHEPGEALLVTEDLGQVARVHVEQVDVERGRVAVVEPDEHLVLVLVRAADDLHAGILERRQRGLFAAGDVYAVEQEVLVAGLVLDVEQAPGIAGPGVHPDRPVRRRGHRPGRVGIVLRRQPDVEHAVARGEPREPLAVGADLPPGARRVAEQVVAGNQREIGEWAGHVGPSRQVLCGPRWGSGRAMQTVL